MTGVFQHAHAVVYHAAPTEPSAPDHAPLLPPIGRSQTHLCALLAARLTTDVNEAEEKSGKLADFLVTSVPT